MAKKEFLTQDVEKTINDLKLYRSGWSNSIREGWNNHRKGSQEILFALYEISGSIILSLEDVLSGHFHDKMALILVQKKLEELVTSVDFRFFDELGKEKACNVITSGTKKHIRVMMETLEALTA